MFGAIFHHHHRHKNLKEVYHSHIPKLKAEHFRGDGAQPTVDLRARMPPVYDQGAIGSCRCERGSGRDAGEMEIPANSDIRGAFVAAFLNACLGRHRPGNPGIAIFVRPSYTRAPTAPRPQLLTFPHHPPYSTHAPRKTQTYSSCSSVWPLHATTPPFTHHACSADALCCEAAYAYDIPLTRSSYLHACSANALCAAFAYDNPSVLGSRLFLYYNERKMEGDVSDDAGACLSDGVEALHSQGLCPETMWPYSDDKV